MKKFSNAMTNCIGQISQLSYDEITVLMNSLRKEREARDTEHLKEKINNAVKAISALTEGFDYLEVEDAEIDLIDIIDGLKKLKNNLC